MDAVRVAKVHPGVVPRPVKVRRGSGVLRVECAGIDPGEQMTGRIEHERSLAGLVDDAVRRLERVEPVRTRNPGTRHVEAGPGELIGSMRGHGTIPADLEVALDDRIDGGRRQLARGAKSRRRRELQHDAVELDPLEGRGNAADLTRIPASLPVEHERERVLEARLPGHDLAVRDPHDPARGPQRTSWKVAEEPSGP